MKKMESAAAILAVVTVSSSAGMRYDEKLEKAAMAIVAEKIGNIRGGFSYAQKLQLVIRPGETHRVVKEVREQVSADGAKGQPPQTGPSSSITSF
jgi:hypothetical protein